MDGDRRPGQRGQRVRGSPVIWIIPQRQRRGLRPGDQRIVDGLEGEGHRVGSRGNRDRHIVRHSGIQRKIASRSGRAGKINLHRQIVVRIAGARDCKEMGRAVAFSHGVRVGRDVDPRQRQADEIRVRDFIGGGNRVRPVGRADHRVTELNGVQAKVTGNIANEVAPVAVCPAADES